MPRPDPTGVPPTTDATLPPAAPDRLGGSLRGALYTAAEVCRDLVTAVREGDGLVLAVTQVLRDMSVVWVIIEGWRGR